MTGPYSVENAVLDRLASRMGPGVSVASGAALSGQAGSIGKLAPLVVVEPVESETSDASSRSDHIIENQQWLVSLVVRHTADMETFRCDYSDVDKYLALVLGALTGWKPAAGTRELRYVGRDDVLHADEGLLEVRTFFRTLYHFSAP